MMNNKSKNSQNFNLKPVNHHYPHQIKLIFLAVLTIFLVTYLGVLTWNEVKKHDYIGRSEQQIYTISISGEGKVTAIPDIAQISLGIQTEKIKVEIAQRENTEKMNKIIKELKGMNITAEDIKTSSYNIYPQYDWNDGDRTLRGYQVSQNVVVKIRDLDKVGEVLGIAGSLGANQIGGLNFTIDEPEILKQQARELALLNARTKAEALAKVADVKLGKLVSFNESSGNQGYPIYADYAMEVKAMGGGDMAPDVEPGSQEIKIYVYVISKF